MSNRVKMARKIAASLIVEEDRRNQMEVLISTILQARSHVQHLREMLDRSLSLIEDCDQKDHIHAEAGDMIVQAPRHMRDLEGEIAAMEFMVLDMMSSDVKEFMPRQLKDRWNTVTSSSQIPGDQDTGHRLPNNRQDAEQFSYLQTYNDGGHSVQDEQQHPKQESIHEQDSAHGRGKISPGGPSNDMIDWSGFQVSYPSPPSVPKNIRR